jgi:hypothetical protein
VAVSDDPALNHTSRPTRWSTQTRLIVGIVDHSTEDATRRDRDFSGVTVGMAAIRQKPRSASIIILDEVEVLHLPAGEVLPSSARCVHSW